MAPRRASSKDDATTRGGDSGVEQLQTALERTVDEGEQRLHRSLPSLLATGAVGGLDVGLGGLAMLVVVEATDQRLLGGLAFGIGFVALTLANSELFTEDFLVPVVAVAAQRAQPASLLRLWGGTLAV